MASETHYIRVNRNNLVADTNLVEKSSVTSTITNPTSGNLWSRVGGRTNEFKYPLPGYCIRFNKSNQSAYIQTTVRTSERDKYKIIIKGEGTVDHLYVDTSGENIAIKQMYPITDSSYFDLSYIAFLNKTTGYLEHLYECEEVIKNQVTLLDVIRCNHATLTDVTSLDAMRTYTKYKEWIADYSNLDDKVQCFGGANAGYILTKSNSYTNLTPLRNENLRSYCLTLEVNQDFNVTKFNSGIELIGDFTDGGTGRKYSHGFTFYKNSSFGCCFGTGSNRIAYETNFNKLLTGVNDGSIKIIPAGVYKLCLIVSIAEDAANSYIKTYCNGVNTWAVNSLNQSNRVIDTSTIKYGTESDTIDMFKMLCQFGGNYAPNYNLPCQISNVRVFGFDVSAEGAAYTVEDYTNDRQIDNPSTFPGVLLYYGNLSYWTNFSYANNYRWLDRGPKNAQLITYNDGIANANRMECPCKNYGTWLNNVGYYNSGDYHEPRAIASGGVIFELSSNMQFEHYWTWRPGTGKVEGYFEEDGTLVCKVAEEVTLVEPFALPYLRLVGGLNAINGSCINKGQEVRITYDDFYLNPDIYYIGGSISSYGKGIYLCNTSAEPEWFYHPKDYKGTVTAFINSSRFGIGPLAQRSKSGKVETIPVSTILWKVKGFKVELLP